MYAEIKNKLCPLVKNPLSDCYCFDLTSKNINPAIHYCGENYTACRIFKNEIANGSHYKKKTLGNG